MRSSGTTFNKRQRERNQKDKKRDKLSRREERKLTKDDRPDAPPGVDPDIADIVPGPQPLPEGFED